MVASPDGSKLVGGGYDTTYAVCCWETTNWKQVFRTKIEDPILDVAFNHISDCLFVLRPLYLQVIRLEDSSSISVKCPNEVDQILRGSETTLVTMSTRKHRVQVWDITTREIPLI